MSGMMVMQVVPDRWSTVAGDLVTAKDPVLYHSVRRPTRGIVLKEETFATLRVVTSAGGTRWLIDAGSRRDNKDNPLTIEGKTATDVYSNFLLQQVSEERAEKQQILETFGEPYVFFFGERARIMSFSGILANSWDFNWEAEWWENYNNELRGTRCVENDARIFLQFDNTLIGGYIMSASAQKNAQERNWVNFSFQMLITSYANLSNPELGNPQALPTISYSFITQQVGLKPPYDAATLAPLRPVLLDAKPKYDGAGGTTFGKNLSLADQLVSAWSNGLKAVSSAWNAVDGALSTLTSLAGQIVNGDDIRIPVGFQGALAFDDQADIAAIRVQYGGNIKFTVFSDNTDEFVGSGDQYASAKTFGSMAFLRNKGALSQVDSELKSDAKQLSQAKAAWAKAGVPVPDVEFGAIVKAVHGTAQLGLTAANGIQNWGAYAQSPNAGNSKGPFAAVISP
jgi:hypothetical protein